MKKAILGVILVVLMVVMVGCAGSNGEKITKPEDLEGKIVGMHSIPISDEEALKMHTATTGVQFEKVEIFNDLSAAVAGLKSGKVDCVAAHKFTADYMTARNDDITSIDFKLDKASEVIMVVRKGNDGLLELINEALSEFKRDGTLDELQNEYITANAEGSDGQDAINVEGGETYYVGVSGDFPPLDYVMTDGKAAGYSVALLTKIAQRAGVNFEFVAIATEAKPVALSSGKIDVVFYAMLIADGFDPPFVTENLASETYYTFDTTSFLVMK